MSIRVQIHGITGESRELVAEGSLGLLELLRFRDRVRASRGVTPGGGSDTSETLELPGLLALPEPIKLLKPNPNFQRYAYTFTASPSEDAGEFFHREPGEWAVRLVVGHLSEPALAQIASEMADAADIGGGEPDAEDIRLSDSWSLVIVCRRRPV